jgi:hypothetical protein
MILLLLSSYILLIVLLFIFIQLLFVFLLVIIDSLHVFIFLLISPSSCGQGLFIKHLLGGRLVLLGVYLNLKILFPSHYWVNL